MDRTCINKNSLGPSVIFKEVNEFRPKKVGEPLAQQTLVTRGSPKPLALIELKGIIVS